MIKVTKKQLDLLGKIVENYQSKEERLNEIEKLIQLFRRARISEIYTLVDYGNLNGLDGNSLNRIYQVFSDRFSIITDNITIKITKYFADKGVLLATNDLMEHQLSEEYYEELLNDPVEHYDYYEELKSEFAGNNYNEGIEETKPNPPDLAENFDGLEEEQEISPLYNLEKFTDDFKHITFSELTTGRGYLEELIEENFLTLLEQVDKLPESHKLDAFNILFKFVKRLNYELLADYFPALLETSKKIMTYDQQCQFLSKLLILESFIESLVEDNLDQMESQIRTIIDNIDEIPETLRYQDLCHLFWFVSIDASLIEKFSSSLLKCVDSLSEKEDKKIKFRQLLTLRDLIKLE